MKNNVMSNKLSGTVKKIILSIAVISIYPLSANAIPIHQVSYADLTGTVLIDFESVAGGTAPGTNYDGIIDLGGASFAERFSGQTLSFVGNSDKLGGAPIGGLSLQTGAAGQNLNILDEGGVGGNVIDGVGARGFPNFNAIGEGAIAILFDNNQSEFGFQSVGGDLGSATFDFWARDGSLIQTINPTNLGVDLFGFSRESGVQDIAGISIWNTDPGGIGFDDIIFDVPGNDEPVPEPGTLALLAIGLLGLVGRARQKTNI